jgi:hypothetical protein
LLHYRLAQVEKLWKMPFCRQNEINFCGCCIFVREKQAIHKPTRDFPQLRFFIPRVANAILLTFAGHSRGGRRHD